MTPERKRVIYLEFLNRCGANLDELPQEANLILRKINYIDLCAPLIWEDRMKGITAGKIAPRYGLDLYQVRNILYLKKGSPWYNQGNPQDL